MHASHDGRWRDLRIGRCAGAIEHAEALVASTRERVVPAGPERKSMCASLAEHTVAQAKATFLAADELDPASLVPSSSTLVAAHLVHQLNCIVPACNQCTNVDERLEAPRIVFKIPLPKADLVAYRQVGKERRRRLWIIRPISVHACSLPRVQFALYRPFEDAGNVRAKHCDEVCPVASTQAATHVQRDAAAGADLEPATIVPTLADAPGRRYTHDLGPCVVGDPTRAELRLGILVEL